MLDMAIEALELAIELMYEKLVGYLEEFWESNSLAFNHGQLSIYARHMDPTIYEWLAEAGENWPWADADQYADELFSCYDAEVMERAFSDVIVHPVDNMWQMIERAIELEEMKQLLEAIAAAM